MDFKMERAVLMVVLMSLMSMSGGQGSECSTVNIYTKEDSSIHDELKELKLQVDHLTTRLDATQTEQERAESLTLLQSLQKDNDNLTAHLKVQEEQHSKEKTQLQKELKEVKKSLDEKSKNYTALTGEKEKLQKDIEEVKKSLDEKSKDLQELRAEALKNCTDGWKYFSGKCYYFSTDVKSWTESRDACVTMGGHLVIIEAQEEQDFLSQQSTEENIYWIGLTDSAQEGQWRWVDNSLLKHTKYWTGTEPDNWTGEHGERPEGEDCAAIDIDGTRDSWQDGFCTRQEKRICESKAK